MNNKLKIYTKETKNGKDIRNIEIITNNSLIHNYIPPQKQKKYSYASTQNKINATKNASSLSTIKQEKKYAYVQQKSELHHSKKLNKSFNSVSNCCQIPLKKEINLSQSGYKLKSKTPTRSRAISKEKVKASINNVIDLKEKISQLNHQIDNLEADHNNIFALGEEAIAQLREENQYFKNQKIKQEKQNSDINPEEIIKEKERSIALLRKQIEKIDIKSQELNEKRIELKAIFDNNQVTSIGSLKTFYQQKAQSLDAQIQLLDPLIEENDIVLLSPEEMTKMSFMLKIIFEVCQLDNATILSTIINNDKTVLDIIVDKLLLLINNTNPQSRYVLKCFFATIANEFSSETLNAEFLKRIFTQTIGIINHFYNKEELNAQLNQIFFKKKQRLLSAFISRDTDHCGLITLEVFKEVFESFHSEHINERLNEYIVFLMKEGIDSDCELNQVAYEKFIDVLIKPNEIEEEIDVYIDKIKNYLMLNAISINDFFEPLSYHIQIIESKEYIKNELLSNYLKEKKILSLCEQIPCQEDDLNNLTMLKENLLQIQIRSKERAQYEDEDNRERYQEAREEFLSNLTVSNPLSQENKEINTLVTNMVTTIFREEQIKVFDQHNQYSS